MSAADDTLNTMAHEHTRGGGKHWRRLAVVLALTATFMAVEAVVGVLTNSLVLVADAAHMLTDAAALSLALLAIWFAQRPGGAQRTYGYYRAEILAALANALLLFAVSGYVIIAAAMRFASPEHVPSVPLLVVASAGLVVNLVSARLLFGAAQESLNVRGAFVEVIGDLLGSAGALAAGIVLVTTGWRYADPLFAMLVGLLILPRTWGLLRGALNVLLESAPHHIRIPDVQAEILDADGVLSVHDLHVWTVTSGFVALSGHVLVAERVDRDGVLVDLSRRLERRFGIDHVTIQVENEALSELLEQPCLPDGLEAPSVRRDGSPRVRPLDVRAK